MNRKRRSRGAICSRMESLIRPSVTEECMHTDAFACCMGEKIEWVIHRQKISVYKSRILYILAFRSLPFTSTPYPLSLDDDKSSPFLTLISFASECIASFYIIIYTSLWNYTRAWWCWDWCYLGYIVRKWYLEFLQKIYPGKESDRMCSCQHPK